MNRSQLMGLDSVGIDVYDIHGYFRELTVGQRTLGFWDFTSKMCHTTYCNISCDNCCDSLIKHAIYF